MYEYVHIYIYTHNIVTSRRGQLRGGLLRELRAARRLGWEGETANQLTESDWICTGIRTRPSRVDTRTGTIQASASRSAAALLGR